MTSTTAPPADPPVDVNTIADLPFHVTGRFPKPLMIGRCRGETIDGMPSKALFERVRDVSLGLQALGMARGDRVALIAESRPEWVVCDLAVLTAGAVTVPIYPTQSAPQARYILHDCGARLAVVSTREQLEKVQEVRHHLPALEAVVIMDAGGSGPSVVTLDEVERRGHARLVAESGLAREYRDQGRAVADKDLATIIYTSGTTGEPKGVMLTHRNIISNVKAVAEVLNVGHEDTALSFLPLSHSFERTVCFLYLLTGVTTVFAESMETVARDIATVRPTLLTGVPRVYEKIQARVFETALGAGGLKASIFRRAMRVGLGRAGRELRGRRVGPVTRAQSSIADRLVFAKIRERFGGRLRFVVSGSAPLSPSVAEFFQAIGLPIIEGYGLTETAPVLTVNPQHAPRIGSVGTAIPGVDLRIAADGEILARGPNIMVGYWNKPEATAEVLKDGWFHTGDVGTIDADGYVTITDRKKDVLVTSGGKKIAPQPIESILKRSPLVAEALVLGERRRYAVALVVPEFTALARRLRDLGHPPADAGTAAGREELVTRPDVVALYQEIVDAMNHDLAQFERIKKIAVLPSEFSIQSGELTPTMKVRRKVVEDRWREVIEALYE